MSAELRPVMFVNLRPYQIAAVTAVRKAFLQSRRVLLVAPTGSGKTVIFAFITSSAVTKGNRVIVLAHRAEIVDQISIALAAMDVAHGRIQPGHPVTDHQVQVAMVQTIARRLDTIPAPSLLVVDECQHAVAGTWAKVAAAWPNAKVLGVTATPERLDGVGLRDAFDEMVIGPDVSELITAGYLAPFRYLAPNTAIDMSAVRSIGGDFNSGDLAKVVDQDGITGNVVEHYLEHLAPRTAIAFCVTIAHAEHVALRFRDAGIPAASIDGSMSADQRTDLVNKLRAGDLRVLTSCEIISEGFDAPAVGGAILLRPTQSFALYRQQVGRSLRPKEDGSPAVIIDHVGNVFRHGLPNAPHEWSLDSKKRTQAEREKAEASVRRCRACGEVFEAGIGKDACTMPEDPECLFRPRILPEREGVLEEVLSPLWAHGLDIRNARGWQWRLLLHHAGADTGRLRQIQIARGYKPGWVRYAAQDAAERRRA